MRKVKKFLVGIFFVLSIFISIYEVGRAESIFFDDMSEIQGKSLTYSAKKGQDLYFIARKFGLAIEHVMFANNMNGIKTYEGQKLLIPRRRILPSSSLKNGLVINLPERGIYYYKNGEWKDFYPVAIGAPGKWMTPVGETRVINQAKDPTWLPPEWAKEEKPVPAGPDNPLGDRWIGLELSGIGIHATNSPVSIGLATSHGCLRMYPESAHKLYEQVYVNMPVKIVYEPIKIGYDPASKQICIEVYPDVYKKTKDLTKYAKEKLAEFDLLPLVDEVELERIIREKRGIPEAVVGSRVVVKINGKPQRLVFSPFYAGDQIMVSSEILKPMGANLVWKGPKQPVEVIWRNRNMHLPVKVVKGNKIFPDDNRPAVYLWQQRHFIPVGYVLKKMQIPYEWVGKYQTILIYSGPKKVYLKTRKKKEPKKIRKSNHIEVSPNSTARKKIEVSPKVQSGEKKSDETPVIKESPVSPTPIKDDFDLEVDTIEE